MTDPMELVDRLDQRAIAARSENTATALGDAIHFEQAAACIRELVEALRPLAIHADHYQQRPDNWVIGGTVANGLPTNRIDVGHCRRAKALISPPATDRGGV